MSANFKNPLLDPESGTPLYKERDYLVSPMGKRFPVEDGIIDILDKKLLDSSVREELKTFETLPIENVCYFRNILLNEAIAVLRLIMENDGMDLSCVEIGGGEGYFAGAFKTAFPGGISYVCDLSLKHLKNASKMLTRIRCDVRRPYLADNSVDVAAFWVSLHHFNEDHMKDALVRARNVLRSGGALVLFEPNIDFFPRRILLSSKLKRLVYFDEEEKALKFKDIAEFLINFGFQPKFVTGHNPPYSWEFLKKLKLGRAFFCITEMMHQLERFFKIGSCAWWDIRRSSANGPEMSLKMGSYFYSIFTLLK